VEIYTGTFVKRIGLKLADRLTAAGVDKNTIASIGGWEIRER